MNIGGIGTSVPVAQPVADQAVLAAVLAARPAVAQMQETAAAVVSATPAPTGDGRLDVYL